MTQGLSKEENEEDEETPNTQHVKTHNQLGVAQGFDDQLDKAVEKVNLISKRKIERKLEPSSRKVRQGLTSLTKMRALRQMKHKIMCKMNLLPHKNQQILSTGSMGRPKEMTWTRNKRMMEAGSGNGECVLETPGTQQISRSCLSSDRKDWLGSCLETC